MNQRQFLASLYLAVASLALLGGCVNVPQATPAPTLSAAGECGRLGAQIAQAEQARRTALAQQHDDWKAVVPFLIAGRYFGGQSAFGAADKRLAALSEESIRLGCARHVG